MSIRHSLTDFELDPVPLAQVTGQVVAVSGLLLEVTGSDLKTGQRCLVEDGDGVWQPAQVVGFKQNHYFLMPFKPIQGLQSGAKVKPVTNRSGLKIGLSWLGRVINGLGEPLDGLGTLSGEFPLSYTPPKVNPLKKAAVTQPLDVGVKAINGLLTIGEGQRVGLFAGSGVGKSVLLGMITRYTQAEIVVVGLIGERGREVREFIEHSLGEAGRQKAIVVVAPADEPALMRLKATELCHAIAAHFRDQGHNVLLLVDSLTRYAMAQREMALALGEPPATKGYPPSVFGLLPSLCETAGNGEHPDGRMSAIYTVLAEGDDQQDPIVDTARAILDGHFVLSRALAHKGHYPAIDVAQSVSRCMAQIVSPDVLEAASELRHRLAKYEDIKKLIPLGAYVPGKDPETDLAVHTMPAIETFLCQPTHEGVSLSDTFARLKQVVS